MEGHKLMFDNSLVTGKSALVLLYLVNSFLSWEVLVIWLLHLNLVLLLHVLTEVIFTSLYHHKLRSLVGAELLLPVWQCCINYGDWWIWWNWIQDIWCCSSVYKICPWKVRPGLLLVDKWTATDLNVVSVVDVNCFDRLRMDGLHYWK